MKAFHSKLRRFSAVLIGLVLIIAGLFKLMDPVGAGLVVEAYLQFFHLGFLLPLSKVLGTGLALLEAVTGAALITGVYRKFFAITASVLIVGFTGITFILWMVNPAFDCGCFGEAIHLTHGQSLLKNLILLALACVAFLPFRDYGANRKGKKIPFYLVSASFLALVTYSWMFIPMTDFTPFNYHSRLLAAEQEDPHSDQVDYVTVFIYEKDGQQGSFTEDQLPDSTWTFIRSESALKEDNYQVQSYPELAFTDAEGHFCDERAAEEFVLVCSVPAPEKMSPGQWSRTAGMLEGARENGFTPLLLVTAEPGTAEAFIPESLAPQERYTLIENACYADYRTLISLNRSNGGATYFNEGDLVRKWASRKLPQTEDFAALRASDKTDLTITADTRTKLWYQAFFLYAVAVLFLL